MTDTLPPRSQAGPAALSFLAGGGELGALIRNHDWANTSLGPPETWPQSLKTAVSIMLTSRQPIWIGWGPDLIYLYNDPYKAIIGGKHPWALGRPTREVWREIWPEIGPMLATAMGGIEGTFVEEQLLIMERNGYPEETYYTFSYSPVRGDDGLPGGIICANSDDTQRVIGDRQVAMLRDLAAETVNARAWGEAADSAITALGRNPRDLTFALLYVIQPGRAQAELAAATGLAPGSPGAPLAIALEDPSLWPIGEVASRHTLQVLPLAPRGIVATGSWDLASSDAVALPVAASSDTGREAVLVVGLNPHRQFDDDYRGFLGLVAGQISAAIASADAYEEERRRAEALAELDRAKTAFFSNVSHEFRTPLTLMLGPLEEVIAGGMDAGEMQAQVALAHRNGTRLLRLVNSLLDFSRIEAGRVRAAYAPVDLAAYTAEVASSFRSAVEKAGLTFQVVVAPLGKPAFIDPEMWEKVLLNLLSNAFKFTLEGAIRVTVAPSDDQQSACVTVADTGIGIPAEEMPRLFERFHRVEGAQGRSFEGSGIGLALVHELVRLHGGDIRAESQVGKGTTFTITVPLGRGHLPADQIREDAAAAAGLARAHEYLEEALRWLPEEAPRLEAAGELTTPGLGALAPDHGEAGVGKRILLADDNADMRAYVSRLLEAQGYAVEGVADGQAALAAARAAPPDLLLTDVMMPGLDGFGLLQAIRAEPATRGVPVIMLSARAGEEAKVEGLDAGADDYLVKPFAARELLARVNANIQMAAVRREADRAIWASEQRFLITQERLSIALSSGGVGVFEWEIDTDRVAVLGPISELYGVDPASAEAAGLPLATFIAGIHPDDRAAVQQAIAGSVGQGAPYRAEYRVVGQGDRREVVALGDLHTRADGARLLAGVIIDVTDLRRAERELHALNTRLEERVAEEVAERGKAEEALRQAQKMEAVGQLTGGVAHDFNNLLTVIIGGLDTIRRCRPGDEARMTRALDMALQGAQRAAGLTGRLLAFSRRQPLDPKPLDLNVMVRDMTELLHRTLGEQIELEGVLASRLWTVEVDQNQLESAIINLAVNARDAMPGGGKLTIETANTDLDERYAAHDSEVIPGQYVMVSVTDCGTGMPPETLARVFEPFFTTKEVGRGTGLGLSMVYGFVKQSGGHVTLYSEEGQGTTVRLYFPRFHAPAGRKDAAPEVLAPRSSDGETVLVVEDNDDVRAYSIQILEELGYVVIQAPDADHAIPILASDARIDLLFTDVVLPGRSGRAIADEARALRPGLKVLFTTGYSRNAIVHHGRLDPGVQLITKPFTFDQLAVRVRDILDQRARD
ncbi:ATP-binding protein [Phenylobacterium sp.]|uniref:ATP-binding protein n=1 Tax=Phenylobacterium sp. TaxID=1871053 RepID=UPI0037848980